jgi:amino acid transporter
MQSELLPLIYIFVLATFIGMEVIRRVSPLLHTPLMSLTNAISAIAVVGSIVIAGKQETTLSTVLGTVATAAVYVLSTVAVFGVVPAGELTGASAPYAVAAQRIWGTAAGRLVAVGAVMATFGALNGWVIMQGQMPLAPAQDGLFPKAFARTSPRGTPTFGLVLSSALTTALAATIGTGNPGIAKPPSTDVVLAAAGVATAESETKKTREIPALALAHACSVGGGKVRVTWTGTDDVHCPSVFG